VATLCLGFLRCPPFLGLDEIKVQSLSIHLLHCTVRSCLFPSREFRFLRFQAPSSRHLMSQRRTDNFLFPSIAKEHFHDYVEKLLQKPPQEYGSMLNQLQVIQQICNTEQYKRSIHVPTPTQQRKDRYLNVHPSVDYRVKLPLIKDDPESDYVNAC